MRAAEQSQRLARSNAARRAFEVFERELVLAAPEIESELAQRFGLVRWDRVRLIGQAQQRLEELRNSNFSPDDHGRGGSEAGPAHEAETEAETEAQDQGSGLRVVERVGLPLECLAAVWRELLRGNQVVVSQERGALSAGLVLLSRISELFADEVLTIEFEGEDSVQRCRDWTTVGVVGPSPRVAFVQPDADDEVAAYLLARACLRRSGFDLRAVHRVVLAGPRPRLERHLRRLWVGAQMGGPEDMEAFAGPVRASQANAYLDSYEAWCAIPGVERVCPGARLEGPPLTAQDASDWHFVAPALLKLRSADALVDAPACLGPMLVLEEVPVGEAERCFQSLAPRDSGVLWLRFGAPKKSLTLRPDDRQVDGALLIERLPPGLPAPRP